MSGVRVRAGLVALLGVLAIQAASGASAQAFWGPGAQVVSASTVEPANSSTRNAALAAGGRYVVFQTTATNLFPDDLDTPAGWTRQGATFRKDIETGELDYVASGTVTNGGTTVFRGAENPSISADGRFIAFSSAEQLAAGDTNTLGDVYVRDMSLPRTDPGAYRLVSALDGSDMAPSYGSSFSGRGSDVTPGVALSADGNRVVFRTMTTSDLAGPGTGLGNLFVRDLQARTTTLVTRTMAEGAAAGGANSASISADGTTVAWVGINAAAQTTLLNGESRSPTTSFYLWQRVADGPSAPTRRITGSADADDPACDQAALFVYDPGALGPCYGPLDRQESDDQQVTDITNTPSLSADGRTVAFITTANARPLAANPPADLFVTDMSAGVSRKAGTVELTRDTNSDTATGGTIAAKAISGDGRRIAFATQRTNFVLPSPRLVDPPAVSLGPVNVYVLDLPSMSIQRATRSFDGTDYDDPRGDTSSLSISGDGKRIGFVSGSAKLFPGDGNNSTDAFVVTEPPPTERGAAAEPPFDPPVMQPVRALSAGLLKVKTTKRRGAIGVEVVTPGAGILRARARSLMKASDSRAKLRLVARKSLKVTRAGKATLLLRPSARYRKSVRRGHTLSATLEVSFTPVRGSTVSVRRPVVFSP